MLRRKQQAVHHDVQPREEKNERSASAALEVEVDGKRNCSPLCCL